MSLSTATNEKSQTFFIFFYIMRSIYMNFKIIAMDNPILKIEVIKKHDTYLFFIFSY